MREIITIWVVLIVLAFAYGSAKAEDTTINYKGQPPPAAMAALCS